MTSPSASAECRARCTTRSIASLAPAWSSRARPPARATAPSATVYRITEEGREEFDARLRQLLGTPVTEHPALASALWFAAYLAPVALLDALEDRIVALTADIAHLEAATRVLREQMRLPRIVLIGAECRQAIRQAELEWTRSLVDELRAGELTWDRRSLTEHFAAEQASRQELHR
jgi:DNA-binding PadR family transcriptional regulator